MKIRVHLYGTLPQRFPSYDPALGLEIVLPDSSSVRDLARRLGIVDSDGGIVTSGGRVLGPDDPLKDGITVQVLQQVHGG
jgi:sulfur carrier protein ThiS